MVDELMGRGRDMELVLAPNEFAFALDKTKGHIACYVGPNKTSLSQTDQPVIFKNKRFTECSLEQAKQTFVTAPEGWYIVLKNPSRNNEHPQCGTSNALTDLEVGKKINIHGPASFALWPGQMAKVIKGHHLRSNQYLIARIYDDEAANANWQEAIIKPQAGESETSESLPKEASFTMGQLIVIKGEDVSFFVPPIGMEVVPEEGSGKYIRNAVTLERLEYCILLDEDGNKRYIRGPAVVVPKPTEQFVTDKNGLKKFKAIELNEISGIYVKVIAPYTEDDKEYKIGDELFLTGKDTMIYFPREEHAIIKYRENEGKHFAIAVPEGEARYVLNRQTGQISLIKGPKMFLPDPRTEVVVRRVLDPKLINLWYPGNDEALEYNRKLQSFMQDQKEDFISETEYTRSMVSSRPKQVTRNVALSASMTSADLSELSPKMMADDFTRKRTHTPPRTLTLDTKYEGAVMVDIWTGYAALVTSKSGTRKVIVGPTTHTLEYDEFLEPITLSTGKPKTTDHQKKTVFLRVLNNKVSDIINAETKDLCPVEVALSYRVNFEDDSDKWFDVENYVKFLCDHLRSLLRGTIKRYGIEEFNNNYVDIIRDAILGEKFTNSDAESGRPGRIFEENGMVIRDVEILNFEIKDYEISELLVDNQKSIVREALSVAQANRRFEIEQEQEQIRQASDQMKHETRIKQIALQKERENQESSLSSLKLENQAGETTMRIQVEEQVQAKLDMISERELAREKSEQEQEAKFDEMKNAREIQMVEAQVKALVEKAKAISPDLIAALQSFSDNDLLAKTSQAMSPLAILGGDSVAEILNRMFAGTKFDGLLGKELVKKALSE